MNVPTHPQQTEKSLKPKALEERLAKHFKLLKFLILRVVLLLLKLYHKKAFSRPFWRGQNPLSKSRGAARKSAVAKLETVEMKGFMQRFKRLRDN